jgi:hypothetical protein
MSFLQSYIISSNPPHLTHWGTAFVMLFLAGCQGGLLAPPEQSSTSAIISSEEGSSIPIELTNIEPNQGSTLGGTVVTLRGKGFRPSTLILIDSEPCKIQGFLSSNAVTCVMPAHLPATVSFTVKNFRTKADGRSRKMDSTLKNAFTYIASTTSAPASLAIGGGRSTGSRFVMDAVIGAPAVTPRTGTTGVATGNTVLLKPGRPQ